MLAILFIVCYQGDFSAMFVVVVVVVVVVVGFAASV